MSKIYSLITVKVAQLSLRLVIILLELKYKEINMKNKRVINISHITRRKWWFSLNLLALIHLK